MYVFKILRDSFLFFPTICGFQDSTVAVFVPPRHHKCCTDFVAFHSCLLEQVAGK